MAIVTSNTTHVDTTNLNSTAFSIQADAALFSVLTQRIYTDTILAPIREWSTNAIDACIEAGVDPHFDVHLPTSTDTTFSVRDYGTGLSQESILTLFTLVGASTKRDSNLYNGQFGLGRLSALSYCESFTIESFYNGSYYSYLISISEGIPVAIELASSTTTESNGLRLSLACKVEDITNFKVRAEKLYRYFSVKPTTNIPLDIDFTPTVATDNWFIDPNARSNYLLMSNIAYIVPNDNRIEDHSFRGLVITVPTGNVSINPGRESLSLDDLTIAYINSEFTSIKDEYVQMALAQIAAAPTEYDAISTLVQLRNSAPSDIRPSITGTFPILQPRFTVPTFSWHESQVYISPPAFATFSTLDYGSKPRKQESIIAKTLSTYHILAIDLKTNYSHAIQSVHELHSSLLVFYPIDKALFRESFDNWVASVGIPASRISYASNYACTSPIAAATPREAGIYVCELDAYSSTISANKLASKPAYLYFPLSGSKPLNEDYRSYIHLRQHLIADHSMSIPPIVGIQKKYLAAAEALDSFTIAEPYLLQLANSVEWHTHDRSIRRSSFNCTLPRDLHMIDTYYRELEELAPFASTTDAVDYANFAHLISTPPIHHGFTYTAEDIRTKYPLIFSLDHSYSSDCLTYYLQLEAYREAHPDSSWPQFSLPN